MKSFFPLFAGILIAVSAAACKKSTCDSNPDANCVCTEEYAPVCGCDNETYPNACHAECAGVEEYTTGKCGL